MKKTTHSTHFHLIAVAGLGLLLGACAAGPASVPGDAEPADEVYEFEPWDGDGMEIPLDGSSLDAFEASMARVKAHTSQKNYTTLQYAIDYLLVYELRVQRDKARLAELLDGKTPNEVLRMINRQEPKSGEKQTKPEATETTLEL
jgi:hypothetical protein